ncbi:uncharacterized protein LOC129741526 [Uranotaenia lowii]|uniref:uncharacterized protein LOC129741526 n=1 Tax=Uranotaenia lowii TaxID=190385 RepID=UPI00247846FD|nr:uncharacterized protein LOC129741526 [Uranotaenia lowii]
MKSRGCPTSTPGRLLNHTLSQKLNLRDTCSSKQIDVLVWPSHPVDFRHDMANSIPEKTDFLDEPEKRSEILRDFELVDALNENVNAAVDSCVVEAEKLENVTQRSNSFFSCMVYSSVAEQFKMAFNYRELRSGNYSFTIDQNRFNKDEVLKRIKVLDESMCGPDNCEINGTNQTEQIETLFANQNDIKLCDQFLTKSLKANLTELRSFKIFTVKEYYGLGKYQDMKILDENEMIQIEDVEPSENLTVAEIELNTVKEEDESPQTGDNKPYRIILNRDMDKYIHCIFRGIGYIDANGDISVTKLQEHFSEVNQLNNRNIQNMFDCAAKTKLHCHHLRSNQFYTCMLSSSTSEAFQTVFQSRGVFTEVESKPRLLEN